LIVSPSTLFCMAAMRWFAWAITTTWPHSKYKHYLAPSSCSDKKFLCMMSIHSQ
jgi:hypothetical protein